MRASGKLVLAFGVAAFLASPAYAQRGRGFGPGALLSNKSVQKELKADDAQVQKLDKLADEIGEKMQGFFQTLQDVPQEERFAKMQERNRAINADIKKSLSEFLKPEQTRRFEQIQLQNAGANSFLATEVQDKLKMTSEQKDKVRGIVEDSRDQMREIMQGFQDDREGAMKKLTELRKEIAKKATDVLTADQKTTWKEMIGAPFEVKFELPAN
jgi:hypothetical protein